MKLTRLLISLLCALTLVGCATQKPPEQPLGPVDIGEELNREDENYNHMGIKSVQLNEDSLQFQYNLSTLPKNREKLFHVRVNGILQPFTFEKNESYSYTQNKTVTEEDNVFTIYVKGSAIQKGEEITLTVSAYDNPDYIPKLIEAVDGNGIVMADYGNGSYGYTSVDYTFTSDKHVKGNNHTFTEFKVDKSTWTEIGPDYEEKDFREYEEYPDLDILQSIAEDYSTPVFADQPIHVKQGGEFTTNIMMFGYEPTDGTITFYLDHLPIKVNGEFDAITADYKGGKHAYTPVTFQLPEDITPGKHTFYTVISTPYLKEAPAFTEYCKQRLIIVE